MKIPIGHLTPNLQHAKMTSSELEHHLPNRKIPHLFGVSPGVYADDAPCPGSASDRECRDRLASVLTSLMLSLIS